MADVQTLKYCIDNEWRESTTDKYMDVTEEQASPFVRHQVRKRVALIFHPEKVSSWDHRRLVGAPG